MRSDEQWQREHNEQWRLLMAARHRADVAAFFSKLAIVLFVLAVVLWLTGCTSTVVPVTVSAQQASWDGGAQNSGVIAQLPDRSMVLTLHAQQRYVGLALTYGKRFFPNVIGNEAVSFTNATFVDLKGVVYTNTGKLWQLDAEHWAKALTMNRWRKEGK